jgi:hypothetical protein
MSLARWARWAPVTGILAAAALVVGFVAIGATPPDSADSGQTILAFAREHRGGLLTSVYLTGLALVFVVWFLGSLAVRLREVGEQRLAAIAFGSGLVIAAVALVQATALAAIAWRPDDLGARDAKLLYSLQELMDTTAAFPLAALAGAAGIAALRSAALPRWLGWASLAMGVVMLVRGANFAETGFFAPQNGFTFLSFVLTLAWLVATSVVLLRASASEHAPVQAPASV